MNRIFLIGLGHRARHGKDTAAKIISQKRNNVIVYHFADPLKEEVMNKNRTIPLIYRERNKYIKDMYYYSIWSSGFDYITIPYNKVTFLHNIFESRNIDVYWGMEGNGNDEYKDSLMLQFWGTNWRRNVFGSDYWIKKVENYILNKVISINSKIDNENIYFVIPDVRFKNEVAWLKTNNALNIKGIYIKVSRLNDDGSIYYSIDRDKNHASEVELEDVAPDYLITAKTGEINKIESEIEEILNKIEEGDIDVK